MAKEKYDITKKLPTDVAGEIESYLTDKEASNLAETSRFFAAARSLFDSNQTAHQDRVTSILLRRVVKGQESSVVSDEIKDGKLPKKALLKTEPTYLLAKGDVTDNSGRHFKNITAFEYAVWAMDSHMYNKMPDCLPNDKAGEEIRKELLAQYESVTTKGLDYTKWCALLKMTTDPRSIPVAELSLKHLNNNNGCIQHGDEFFYLDNESNPKSLTLIEPEKSKKLHVIFNQLKDNTLQMSDDDKKIEAIVAATGSPRHHVMGQKHFDFQPLTQALKDLASSFDAGSIWTQPQRDSHWCTVVGRAQRDIPAHVAAEYCRSDRSFYPTPDFRDKTLPRELEFDNWMTNKNEFWWPGSAGVINRLGVDFGILRGVALQGNAPLRVAVGQQSTAREAAAITALCEERTVDLASLKCRLHNPLQKPDADPEHSRGGPGFVIL